MCRLYETNVFGARAVFGMDASCDWGGVVTTACTAYWAGLLCSVAVTALSGSWSGSSDGQI